MFWSKKVNMFLAQKRFKIKKKLRDFDHEVDIFYFKLNSKEVERYEM